MMQRRDEPSMRQAFAVDHVAMRRGIHLVWSQDRKPARTVRPQQMQIHALPPRQRATKAAAREKAGYSAPWWMRFFGMQSDPAGI